jgi:hypothetical protein
MHRVFDKRYLLVVTALLLQFSFGQPPHAGPMIASRSHATWAAAPYANTPVPRYRRWPPAD